jgi:hypothetical protein
MVNESDVTTATRAASAAKNKRKRGENNEI